MGWRLALGRRSWRWKYRSSSCALKSAVVRRGPRSSPITFIPALASSAASIPPTAPIPTMTTSDFSVAMALSLHAGDRRACERLFAFHIRARENRLRTGEAHELPSCKVLVPAVDRIGGHALHRVRADRIEKVLRRRPREFCRFARLQRCNDFVLPRGLKVYE